VTLRLVAFAPSDARDERGAERRSSRPFLTVCRGGVATGLRDAAGIDGRAAGGGAAGDRAVPMSTGGAAAAAPATVPPRALAPALRLVGNDRGDKPEAEGGLASLEEFLRRASVVLEEASAPVVPIRSNVGGLPVRAAGCRPSSRVCRGSTGGMRRVRRPTGTHVRLAAAP
jgi:hypothetical protein